MNAQDQNPKPDSNHAERSVAAAQPAADSPFGRRAAWFALFAIAVFLLGFGPMWQKSTRLSKELDQTRTELRLQTIQFMLADAALDARRGDYEPARQKLSRFYSLLREEADRPKDSAFTADQKQQFEPILAQRDDVITLLARGDASAAERLGQMYLTCRKILGSPSP